MDYDRLLELLSEINGCTFASIDSVTSPSPGILCQTTGTRVILFTNKRSSGYDNLVRRRLIECGKNPDDFVLSDLPWGERIPNTPIIKLRERLYLQTVVLKEGESRYSIGGREVDPSGLYLPSRRTNQGLPEGKEVAVRTFRLDSIVRIKLLGEELK